MTWPNAPGGCLTLSAIGQKSPFWSIATGKITKNILKFICSQAMSGNKKTDLKASFYKYHYFR